MVSAGTMHLFVENQLYLIKFIMGAVLFLLVISGIILLWIHLFLVIRFMALSRQRNNVNPFSYHLKWLLVVALLPIIGYYRYTRHLKSSNF